MALSNAPSRLPPPLPAAPARQPATGLTTPLVDLKRGIREFVAALIENMTVAAGELENESNPDQVAEVEFEPGFRGAPGNPDVRGALDIVYSYAGAIEKIRRMLAQKGLMVLNPDPDEPNTMVLIKGTTRVQLRQEIDSFIENTGCGEITLHLTDVPSANLILIGWIQQLINENPELLIMTRNGLNPRLHVTIKKIQ